MLPEFAPERAQSDLPYLAGLARDIREMLDNVDDVQVAAHGVRQTNAMNKLVSEAMKAWRALDRDQFALCQEISEAHLRTQRRAGELLVNLPKNGGGRPPAAVSAPAGALPSTLSELGIDAHESHRWQLIASVPEEIFEEFISECREMEREITSAGVLALARRLRAGGWQSRPSSRAALLREYDLACAELAAIVGSDAGQLSESIAPERREKELRRLRSLRLWIAEMARALRTTPFVGGP